MSQSYAVMRVTGEQFIYNTGNDECCDFEAIPEALVEELSTIHPNTGYCLYAVQTKSGKTEFMFTSLHPIQCIINGIVRLLRGSCLSQKTGRSAGTYTVSFHTKFIALKLVDEIMPNVVYNVRRLARPPKFTDSDNYFFEKCKKLCKCFSA